MTNLAKLSVETLWEDEEFVLFRPVRDDERPILVSMPASAQPTTETVAQLNRAYALRDELDSAWAARPVAMDFRDGRPALLIEDPGGGVLAKMIGTPWDLKPFLKVSIGLAASLSRLHSRGIIHKNVKPSNILVKTDTFSVWLAGFGIASRLPRQRQAPDPPEIIAGTLAYMAPEQTGRMNRSTDARSDLYSFGITLYEMLTGTLPFATSDPMEWIHWHIARQPMRPEERIPGIPAPVSAIVMKLLAKTAEDRYQTAAGAESDLRRCLTQCELKGRIDPFTLGQDDTPDGLLIPETLYGRTREVDALLASFDRIVTSGKPELVLVSGYSGIGKSAVVNELHKALVPPRGFFASGKFDQYKRDIPYATLAQAFRTLIGSLLVKSDSDLRPWRDALLEALGPNSQLVSNLIPELTLIIGEQPAAPEIPNSDARARFHLVFRRFIGVFARPEHPLALFVDDLQWFDAATLDLIEDLLTQPDVKYLMLIGAYRDNEVGANHPLARKLQSMRQAGLVPPDIVLAPLRREDVRDLVADALHCADCTSDPLADLVHDKTGGNPFFTIQFLSALSEEGLLAFDYGTMRWSWDLARIHAKEYTDNIADLMVSKLNRLPLNTQVALQQLACLGNSAEFSVLEIARERAEQDLHDDMLEALQTGLLTPSDGSYRFLHDRVQEAAYSLIPENQRAEVHLRIGRLLSARTPLEKREEAIFEIVNQFNRALHLITSVAEREFVAELNLLAARRAKAATAYASALNYLRAGRELLTEDTWKHNRDIIFSIECLLAECEVLTADVTKAEHRLSVLAKRTQNARETALVTRLRLTLYVDRSDRAVDVLLEYMRGRGTVWTSHPFEAEVLEEYKQIWSLLGKRQIEELIDAPLITDPDVLDLMNVLAEAVAPAVYTDQRLLAIILCRMVCLSLEYGNCDASCFAYVQLSMTAGPLFGDYQAQYRFAKLGCDLVEKHGLLRYQARVYMNFTALVTPWVKHVREQRELYDRGFDLANRVGDLIFAAFSRRNLVTCLLVSGETLSEVQAEAIAGLEFATSIRFVVMMNVISTQFAFIRMLRGLTEKFGSFNGEGFDEAELEHHLASSPRLVIAECWYWIRKLQAYVLAGDSASALKASAKAKPLIWTTGAFLEVAEYHFYSALCHAACCNAASSANYEQHAEALVGHHKQLMVWAENCPENFENRAALVGAEIARIEGRTLDAEQLYEQAISSANNNGFVQNEALAYETAGRFYEGRGFQKFADTYFLEARSCYQRWGADGKVAQLDRLYPHLRKDIPISTQTSTISMPAELLDLATVVKVSQTVSGEIVLERLVDSLMRTAVEHAGAERGALILSQDGELRIAAEATINGDTIVVSPRDSSADVGPLPDSIVRYVVHTQERVLLDDAFAANPFSDDIYVRQHRARSILCLPLINRAQLIGMLYLENNLASHVFTSARIAVLEPLASQAAISLENARLYNDTRQMETYLKAAQALSRTGSFGWHLASGEIVWSEETYKIIGYDRDVRPTIDLVFQRIHPEDIAAVHETLERATLNGTDLDLEHRLLFADGSIKSVHVMAYAVKDSESKVVEYVGALMDITERKRAEDALRKSQGELAHLGRVMTMGELVASIAHEVNQPLASVVNSAGACLRWLDAERFEEARRSASRAIAESHRASEIIGRIRALAKKAPPQKNWLDVNEMIFEVIELARSEMERNGVALETQFSAEVPIILADRVQVQQVILNLMMNAIEAMNVVDEDQRELLIRSASDEPGCVVISVRDSGPGLDPHGLESLFDAFHTTKPDGLGMGLSISRSIIEAHRGRLWATANAPRGATFQFTLPTGSEKTT